MKHFVIYLRDGREVQILAETYRRDGEQYVFEKPNSSEVQFFRESDVTGIIEAPAAGITSIPHHRPPLV
jgi:hypothetical protein